MDINPNTIMMAPQLRADEKRDYVNSEGRTRFLQTWFNRPPNGRWLEKDRAPLGFCTPSGLVWGHALDEIGYIERQPGIPVTTIYSRSQVKELGELYDDYEFDGPLVRPRVRRPWPVLKLPKKHPANTDPPLGAIDQGCEEEHEDPECRTYTMRWDEFSDDKGPARAAPAMASGTSAIPEPAQRPGCSADSPHTCRGHLEPNNGSPPLKNWMGAAYHYLWCDHFLDRIKAQKDSSELLARTVHDINRPGVLADKRGIYIFDSPEEMDRFRVSTLVKDLGKPVYELYSPPDAEVDAKCDEPLELDLPNVDNNPGLAESDSPMDVDESEAGGRGENDAQSGDDGSETEGTAESDTETDDDVEPVTKGPPASGLFNVQDLPKLEEFIPDGLFPDVLLVHDPQKLTNHEQTGDDPVKYKRVYPVFPRDKAETKLSAQKEELVAHLHLHPANQLGSGHHSFVYTAPLTLPPPLSARSRTGQCTVAAKLAYNRCTAHTLLKNEGEVYNALPKHTQEEYCGFNFVPPCHRYPVPVGAIVPKFFGFYVPVSDSHSDDVVHADCSEDEPCRIDRMSPILLMEECGKPVEPEKFNADQRTECFSLLLRLHSLPKPVRQGSFYVRNIMIQPGPLTVPPERRSFAYPSFRLIDFGRGERFEGGEDKQERAKRWNGFQSRLWDELRIAREQLLIDDPVIGF
ncbi:hypothetical protein OH76DRAFT_1470364 [Lentinus brumalis]|uniref:Protein kinase domain-containing protein n=1 Tax=Lentinus brumalis TaxID=2498619 RepID=A0A371DIQ8_9APHY|nr:hypothetical protein OH76DRAFT_1470364 [Polyporus brumalis]